MKLLRIKLKNKSKRTLTMKSMGLKLMVKTTKKKKMMQMNQVREKTQSLCEAVRFLLSLKKKIRRILILWI